MRIICLYRTCNWRRIKVEVLKLVRKSEVGESRFINGRHSSVTLTFQNLQRNFSINMGVLVYNCKTCRSFWPWWMYLGFLWCQLFNYLVSFAERTRWSYLLFSSFSLLRECFTWFSIMIHLPVLFPNSNSIFGIN